jgi:hypothetical protein
MPSRSDLLAMLGLALITAFWVVVWPPAALLVLGIPAAAAGVRGSMREHAAAQRQQLEHELLQRAGAGAG